MKPNFTLEFIKNDSALQRLTETLTGATAFAVDIETSEWWNRQRERIALLQIAYRSPQEKLKVAVVDALARLDLNILKPPMEDAAIIKVIHNAAFDAARISEHYKIQAAPVHDTMLAARVNKESVYSLKGQALLHLGIVLDKSARKSDWSRRPLDARQISYAALDAYAALLLYEHQIRRNVRYEYRPKTVAPDTQFRLPLEDVAETQIPSTSPPLETAAISDQQNALSKLSEALLGIAAELPTRYSLDSLAVSLTDARTGLAGWIIDRRLGRDARLDEETIRLAIADLCERKLLLVTETRRLVASEAGAQIWRKVKDK